MRTVPRDKWSLRQLASGDYRLRFRDSKGTQQHDLELGSGGNRYLFREHGVTYLLIIDRGYDTVIMEVFDSADHIQEAALYLQDWEIKEYLGRKALKQMPITIARKMASMVVDIENSQLVDEYEEF